MTVNEYFIEEGMKKWEKYAYDKDVNRVEKQYYNPRGRLVKKMLYVYEYSK